MATRIPRALAGAALLPLLAGGLSAQNFEGVVTWQLRDGNSQMVQYYKGGKVRTEMGREGRQMIMLMDAEHQGMTMVMPEQKMYMTMDMSRMMEQAQAEQPKKTPKFTDTGKTETIAGHTCTVYRMAEDAGQPDKIEMCAAKGMGFLLLGSGGMGRGRDPMGGASAALNNPEIAKLYKDGFFPLRVSSVEGGKNELIMQVSDIAPKSLDGALFEVPSGYQEMKMPAGMPRRPPGR